MSTDYDDDFRAEDPPEEYLIAEAEKHAEWHREDIHGGGECDCPPAPVVYAEEAPF